jgi:2-keto-4-pentenoate hydratase/2-oxohepta-3-ene-1,7-dioic acid hydratase in catechol pathway
MGFTNYISFVDQATGLARIGHYDKSNASIQPLSFKSGTPIANLYQVIESGDANIVPAGEPLPFASATVLAPITGRDVLAVGKNYSEHAKEFNSSGYDSSDKVDIPSHPVIFTKRATSIIAHGEDIYPHPGFTETVDYEGEIGVIIGKSGFRIAEQDAMDYVWGYTIINDMTARERQRDHKQFYIGKSPDTFCPMVRITCNHRPPQSSRQMIFLMRETVLTTEQGPDRCTCKALTKGSPPPDTSEWRVKARRNDGRPHFLDTRSH